MIRRFARAAITLAAGASAYIYALNSAARYGRYEIDVSLEDGAHFELNGAIIGGGSTTLEIVTTVRHAGGRQHLAANRP